MVMAMIRLSGLGISLLGSAMLLAFIGCDSGGTTTTAPGAGGSGASTATETGGSVTNGGANTGVGGGTHATGGQVGTTTGGSVSTGVGGGGNTTSGCGTAPSATGSLTMASTYITGSNYSGYGYAFISPSTTVGGTTANCTLGGTKALCAAGTLPADSSSGTIAGIGLNLNQSSATGSTANNLSITISSVTVGFTNPGGSALRVQIVQGTSTYYCYDISTATSPVTITPSQFNTKCWDGSGSTWDGTNASAVQLIIPSQAAVNVSFSACLTSLTLS